jgi:hypothetical protein
MMFLTADELIARLTIVYRNPERHAWYADPRMGAMKWEGLAPGEAVRIPWRRHRELDGTTKWMPWSGVR